MLALLLCVMVLALTVPLRQYLAQTSRLASLRSQQTAQQKRIASLEEAVRLHQDPAYVELLARERLHYARPGEVPFIVLTSPAAAKKAKTNRAASAGSGDAWYANLWSSVRAAGAAGK